MAPEGPPQADPPSRSAVPDKPGSKALKLVEKLNPQRTFAAGKKRVQFIPVPVIDFDPNEGLTAGAMGIFMIQRPSDDAVTGIITPQYTWNKIVGHTGTLDYQGFYRRGFKLHLYGSYAERNYWEAFGLFEQDGRAGVPVFYALESSAIKDPYPRFYGLGAGTQGSAESAYINEEFRVKLRAGYRLFGVFSAVIEEEYFHSSIRTDVIPNVPSLLASFPLLAGTPRSGTLYHRVALEADTRTEGTFSRAGVYARLYGLRSDAHAGSDVSWWGWGAEAVYLRPVMARTCWAAQLLFDQVSGSDRIPFNRLPSLGGDRALRGFGGGRFYDRGRWLVQNEFRVAVLRLNWFDVHSEMQLDPFLDIGRVFHDKDDFDRRHIEVTGGLGWRLEVKPDILVRVDVGFSRDGPVAFIKMGYPF